MNENIIVRSENVINIAIESWKLSKLEIQNSRERMALKKFLHQLNVFLTDCKVDVVDLVGQVYDPGMAVEVIYAERHENGNTQKEIIVETIRPIIFINGALVKHGQVVTKKQGGENVDV